LGPGTATSATEAAAKSRSGRSSPVVAIAVYYDVGIRSEPEGRTGFAHLFEHLMFQGSANLEKLPSNALSRGLFLEADRMRSPRITEENLANQIAVVKEEIRANVLNRPYGARTDQRTNGRSGGDSSCTAKATRRRDRSQCGARLPQRLLYRGIRSFRPESASSVVTRVWRWR
jgi:hypothetical protein